jgi:hypothetical protein
MSEGRVVVQCNPAFRTVNDKEGAMKDGRCIALITVLFLLFSAFTLVVSVPNMNAATPEAIENSITLGSAWLAGQQRSDGAWQLAPFFPFLE